MQNFSLTSSTSAVSTRRLPRRSRATQRGFSLVELLAVIGIISVLAGASVPAWRGLNGGQQLNTGTQMLASWLNLARSEAIARRTVVRFAVAREWSGQRENSLRKASLWAWDNDLQDFSQISPWQELPVGIVVEPEVPQYLRTAAYAQQDASAIRGESVFDARFEEAEFIAGDENAPIRARFIEFLPSGNVRLPGSSARRIIYVAAPGYVNGDGNVVYTSRSGGAETSNWAQINVDTLTGRARVYQP